MKKILILKPSSLGDIIHVFPALEVLKKHEPDLKVHWLVRSVFADILEYSPLPVVKRIIFEREKLSHWDSFPGAFFRLLNGLRHEKYDFVLDFQGLLRSGIIGFLAKKNGPAVGFAEPREKAAALFYGEKYAVPEEIHAIERNVGLVNAFLGTADPVPEYRLPYLAEHDHFKKNAEGKTIVGIIPGARWRSKRFPESLFSGVMRILRQKGPANLEFWIIGSRDEQNVQSGIIRLSGETTGVLPLAGKTGLQSMTEALRHCSAVLCNDSGPMHAAAAAGVPVVALFGSTLPERTGPYGRHVCVLRAENLDCLGCMERHCGRFHSPHCHRIEEDFVAARVLDALNGKL